MIKAPKSRAESWSSSSRRKAAGRTACGRRTCEKCKPNNAPGFAHRPSTTSIPDRIVSTRRRESFTTCSSSTLRSSVTSCDTFATESFESLVARAGRSTFPGASAQRRLLVRGTHTTVAMRLRLNESPCTTSTGRRNPGADPAGDPRSAHQMSPWLITSHSTRAPVDPLRAQTRRLRCLAPRTSHRAPA